MLSFVYGLSDHPDDVIDLICERGAAYFTDNALNEFQQKCWNPDPADLGTIEAKTHRQTHVILYHIDELIRKVKAEKIDVDTPKEQTLNLRNRYLFVCDRDCSDFILSRTYIIKEFGASYISFICPDPATNYDHGANNDPVPYVIGNPHWDGFFRPLAKIIGALCHHHKIVITGVYSPNMCLKEKDFKLEGHLVLDVSSEQADIFSFIKETELLKLQRVFFTGFKMFLPEKKQVDGRCFEQVQRWVHFSSNLLALEFVGFEIPALLIEHMAQEVYGAVEFQNVDDTLSNVTTVPSPEEQRAKGSSLQILSFAFSSMSTQDIKTLVRLNRLPQLRVLHLRGSHQRYCLGVLLASGSPSLEELLLGRITLSKQDINTFLDILTKGGLPKLNCLILQKISPEYVEHPLSDVKLLSKYGLEINQLERLSKLEYWNKVTEAYLALEKDILFKTKLNEANIRSLIRAMLPAFTELDLSNNSLFGCLGDIVKSPIFSNLRVLDLSNTNLRGINDMRIVSTVAQEGKLRRLRTLNLSKNNLTGSLKVMLENEFLFLETLLLEDTKLSVTDVRALSTAEQKGKLFMLRTLNLSKNNLTDTVLDFVKCRFYCLNGLLLKDTKLSVSDVQALSMASWLSELKTLNLSKNILTERLVLIVDNKVPHLETLLLEDTGLSTRDILALSSAVRKRKLPVLQHLNISQQNVGDLELAVTNLIRRCAIDIDREIQVKVSLDSFGREFKNDVQSVCMGSKVNVL